MRKRKEKRRGRVGALLAAGVLGHGLRAFTDCVFAQLSRQVESDGCLHLTTGDGVLLVVVGEPRGLGGDALEDVVDEGVHDAHGLAGDPSVGVDLLQDLVDVDRVALLAAPPLLLLSFARGLGFDGGCLLLAFGGSNLSWHGRFVEKVSEKTMRRMMRMVRCVGDVAFISRRGITSARIVLVLTNQIAPFAVARSIAITADRIG